MISISSTTHAMQAKNHVVTNGKGGTNGSIKNSVKHPPNYPTRVFSDGIKNQLTGIKPAILNNIAISNNKNGKQGNTLMSARNSFFHENTNNCSNLANRKSIPTYRLGHNGADYDEKLTRSFFECRGLAYDQIRDYEDFLYDKVKKIVEHRVIRLNDGTHVKFCRPRYTIPCIADVNGKTRVIFPQIAREEHRTYSTTLKVDLEQRRDDTGELVCDENGPCRISGVKVAEIPVMTGSSRDSVVIHGIDKDREALLQIGECPHDPSGYFIITGGNEKMVLIQENLRTLQPMIIKKQKEYICKITCLTIIGQVLVELRHAKKTQSINIFLHIFRGRENNVPVFQIFRILGITNCNDIIDYILQFVPHKNKSKVRIQLQGSRIVASEIEDDFARIYERSIYITNKKRKKALQGREMVQTVYNKVRGALFPHIGFRKPQSDKEYNEITESKKMLLGLMVARYAEFLAGVRKADSLDSWCNKRLVLAGTKMRQLFRTLWDSMLNKIEESFSDNSNVKKRTLDSVDRYIKPSISIITNDMEKSFSSDKWGASKRTNAANVTDIVDRGKSLISLPDQLLRINTPTGRRAPQIKARSVQSDQHGYVGAVATPSSDACGLVKNKAIGCEVSIERDGEMVETYLRRDSYIKSTRDPEHDDLCMLNARPLGWCNGKVSREMLVKCRRNNEIYHDTALVYDSTEKLFDIHTNSGRVIKAFIIIGENNVPLIYKDNLINESFDRLCELGIIEWLDVREATCHYSVASSLSELKKINNKRKILEITITGIKRFLAKIPSTAGNNSNSSKIAKLTAQLKRNEVILKRLQRKKYDLVDIDPNLSFGVAASMIPWSDRNQGPRNSFQCSMGRQALGLNHSNTDLRFPTTGKILTYPEPPIAATQMQYIIGMDELPAGENIVVAVQTTKSNEEDAVRIKKEFLQRGGLNFRICYSYSTIIKKPSPISNGGVREELTTSYPFPRHTIEDYRCLDDEGIVEVGSVVRPGDCLICKVRISTPTRKGNGQSCDITRKDASVYVDPWEGGIVDFVKVTYNSSQEKVIKVRIAKSGYPIKGDKVATRQAQKSTIGEIIPEAELPYTKDGITADITMNPHAIPKRMTIGMPVEMLTCKLAAMLGIRVDATAFRDFQTGKYGEMLEELFGFRRTGVEKMYSPLGDKVLEYDIMIGPTYYQLLSHQVSGKFQCRGEGVRVLLTRLPPRGRKAGGGIRLGEQGRMALVSHGTANVLHDRTLKACDAHEIVVCIECNCQSVVDIGRGIIYCPNCESDNFGRSTQAYTYNLLRNYCATGGIRILSVYNNNEGNFKLDTNKCITNASGTVDQDDEEEDEEEDAYEEEEEDEEPDYDAYEDYDDYNDDYDALD